MNLEMNLNLDDMSTDDLEAAAEVFGQLKRYAGLKRNAMTSRATGSIELAQRFESECEKIYGDLPRWAMW